MYVHIFMYMYMYIYIHTYVYTMIFNPHILKHHIPELPNVGPERRAANTNRLTGETLLRCPAGSPGLGRSAPGIPCVTLGSIIKFIIHHSMNIITSSIIMMIIISSSSSSSSLLRLRMLLSCRGPSHFCGQQKKTPVAWRRHDIIMLIITSITIVTTIVIIITIIIS